MKKYCFGISSTMSSLAHLTIGAHLLKQLAASALQAQPVPSGSTSKFRDKSETLAHQRHERPARLAPFLVFDRTFAIEAAREKAEVETVIFARNFGHDRRLLGAGFCLSKQLPDPRLDTTLHTPQGRRHQ